MLPPFKYSYKSAEAFLSIVTSGTFQATRSDFLDDEGECAAASGFEIQICEEQAISDLLLSNFAVRSDGALKFS